ncbi:YbaK/prolyl-tRNA synthetase associated domain-containing protein [Natronococcus amylolyticus DSM 10524]|uniref:YbaK/prolyl-tRNA synthetase associated domain-containing protein n=1 Tax=Natronococcus amylolyticus DSM 10524 TaxID=1227497 RepID=L9X8B6_9EURY|nr:YbaK/EbsC family protein [Natronococcus amylolyticus]ELY57965.1 YbaK/prolyl-tRNA synthetase associated domain-containing protein [Natronococcus amylolyticus DSM 10524]
MHPRAATFAERAHEDYGFEPDVEEFPEGTKTAEDAADAVGCDVAQIASSLAFDVDGSLVVCVTSGANRVDESALGAVFDVSAEDIEMADPDRIRETLGWSIGGVPPFCHDREVPVVIDETLLEFDTVWAAAGTPTAVFPIDPDRLRRHADAEPAAVGD